MKYVDPDGRICYSYYDNEKGKFGIITYSHKKTKALNIFCSVLDFYPFGLGEKGKRAAEFMGSGFCTNLKLIDSSTSKAYMLNDTVKDILDRYSDVDNVLNSASEIANVVANDSKLAKILGKASSFTSNVSNYVINPALLGISVSDFGSATIDNFIVGVFGNSMYSTTREGAENKYKLVQNEVLQSLKTGNLQLNYCKEKSRIEYRIINADSFYKLVKKLNEME